MKFLDANLHTLYDQRHAWDAQIYEMVAKMWKLFITSLMLESPA